MNKLSKQYFIFIFNRFLNVLFGIKALNRTHRDRKLIVSLTTYNKRLPLVFNTIETLMSQSIKPDAIVLWIYRGDINSTGTPVQLRTLEKMGLDIKVVDEDIKSYRKLIYALSEYNDANIITCDDDVYYPYTFIEGLYRVSKKYPDSVVAYRCTYIKRNATGLAPYLSWESAMERGPSYNLFPTGAGGILYPPGALNIRVFNKCEFMELAPTGDDIWFKFMALLNNTKTVMVDRYTEFPTVPHTQDEALWRINTTGHNNQNDIQIDRFLDKYDVIDRIK